MAPLTELEKKLHRKQFNRNNYLKVRQKLLKRRNGLRRRRKLELLKFLGGKCLICGIADERVLQLDHINGGGTKERRNFKHENYQFFQMKLLQSDPIGFRKKFQLLCANCNWIKRRTQQEDNQWKNRIT